MGGAQNFNGANSQNRSRRFVARRTSQGVQAGRQQFGTREQRRADLRYAFRNMGEGGAGAARNAASYG